MDIIVTSDLARGFVERLNNGEITIEQIREWAKAHNAYGGVTRERMALNEVAEAYEQWQQKSSGCPEQ